MRTTLLEELYLSYCAMRFADRGIKPTTDIFELSSAVPDIYEKLGGAKDDLSIQLEDAVTYMCCAEERHGFLNGIKLGMLLAQEIFGSADVSGDKE